MKLISNIYIYVCMYVCMYVCIYLNEEKQHCWRNSVVYNALCVLLH